jgi:hypothetical protein
MVASTARESRLAGLLVGESQPQPPTGRVQRSP